MEKYEGRITTSEVTFIELMLLAKRYNLNLVKIASSVTAICGIEDEKLLRAAIYIRDYKVGVFDAFHESYCSGAITSSDSVFDKLGIRRIKLEPLQL